MNLQILLKYLDYVVLLRVLVLPEKAHVGYIDTQNHDQQWHGSRQDSNVMTSYN